MECQEFLERYSELRDRADEGAVSDASGLDALEVHLEGCDSCRRYHEVVAHGVELVRSFSGPRPRSDFNDRLRHRIYHADLVADHRRRDGSSPLVALALAAAAVLAGVGAWSSISSPAMPTAMLPGITAAAPERVPTLRPISLDDGSVDRTARDPAFLTRSNLWSQASSLLYEHSTLYHRYREGRLVRTGLH